MLCLSDNFFLYLFDRNDLLMLMAMMAQHSFEDLFVSWSYRLLQCRRYRGPCRAHVGLAYRQKPTDSRFYQTKPVAMGLYPCSICLGQVSVST